MDVVDFKNLFESSPGLYLVITPDFQICAVSNLYLKATYTQRAEIVGKNLFEVFPDNPSDIYATGVNNLRSSLEKVLKTKNPDKMAIQKYDIRNRERLDGGFEVKYWRPYNTPVLNGKGEVNYVIHQVEDVTEVVQLRNQHIRFKKSNEELERLRLLFESLPGKFVVLSATPEFTILEASDEYLEVTQTKREQILGRGIFEIFPDDPNDPETKAVEKARASFIRVIQTGSSDLMGISKHSIRTEDSKGVVFEEKYWSPINSPVFGPNGEVEYIIHRVEDVTEFVKLKQKEARENELTENFKSRSERLEAEIYQRALEIQEANEKLLQANNTLKEQDAQIKENENRLRSIFENSMDAILLATLDNSILITNGATTRMFGYTEKELQALGREALFDPTDPRLKPALKERELSGNFRGELTFKRKDGTKVPIEISSVIFSDEKGKKWTSLFIRDISERRKAEKEKEELHKQLNEEKKWVAAVIDKAPMAILVTRGRKEPSIIPNLCAKKTFGPDVDWKKGIIAVLGVVSEPETCRSIKFDELATSRALENHTTVQKEELLCRKDGVKIPVLVNSGPIHNDDGEIIGAVTTFQDITELKGIQTELAEANKQIVSEKRWLQAVFEGSPIGIVIVHAEDSEHPIPNLHAKKIFGPRTDWSLGRTSYLGQACDKDGNPLANEDLTSSRILRGETIIGEEQLLRFTDGREYPIVVAGGPITDTSGKQNWRGGIFSRYYPIERA